MSVVGDNIRKRREEQNLSQNKLAKLAGIAQPTLSAIESSTKSPTIETVMMLASALKCTVGNLIDENTEHDFSLQEIQIIQDFRSLNQQGREYVLQSLAMAVQLYISREHIQISNMETAR